VEIYRLLDEAWVRVGPEVLGDEGELRARLARRRAVAEARPPRAFCAAVRANDTRLTPSKAVIDCPGATREGQERAHRVVVDTRLLKHLTALVNIPAPGNGHAQGGGDSGGLPECDIPDDPGSSAGGAVFRGLRGHGGFRCRWFIRGGISIHAPAG
jgi:hypothetical protein